MNAWRTSPRVDRRDAGSADEGWGRALVGAAVMLVVSLLGFVVVPDRLLAFLSTRLIPRDRDFWVMFYVVVFFIVMSWLFVRI